MYHLRFKGSHYQIGEKRGRLLQRARIAFPLHLDSFQLEHGRKSEEILRDFFPEVCREIEGVCDTIGVEYSPFVSWMLCMGCCMYNLRENIPVEVRGCTAFSFTRGGNVFYARNNDLPPYLRAGCKSELYAPKGGNCFLINTSSFINGEEGMNEHGLAVAMTFVLTLPEKIRPGFNSCFVVRYLLEKADSVDDALRRLMELPVASNCNILLADKSGQMVVAECTPERKNIREAVTFSDGRAVCAVNSFTSDELRPFDDAHGDDYNAAERYRTVMANLPSPASSEPVENTKRLLRGEFGFMCQYDNEPDFETVWSSIFDLKSGLIYRAEGDPRKKKFITDNRLCKISSGI